MPDERGQREATRMTIDQHNDAADDRLIVVLCSSHTQRTHEPTGQAPHPNAKCWRASLTDNAYWQSVWYDGSLSISFHVRWHKSVCFGFCDFMASIFAGVGVQKDYQSLSAMTTTTTTIQSRRSHLF